MKSYLNAIAPRLSLLSVLVVSAMSNAPLTFAAEVEPAFLDGESETYVVVARKVAEDPITLPFSVEVVESNEIEAMRVRSIEELLLNVPGVSVSSMLDPGSGQLKIRGVGALSAVSEDDSSVALHIDGVPFNISNISLTTLDTERVEILKGPQGSIVGRNSEAGAVNIYSKAPTRHTEGYLRAEIGEDNYQLFEGAMGGALNENVLARAVLRYSNVDSHVINEYDNEPFAEPENLAGRLRVTWLIDELQEIEFAYTFDNLEHSPGVFALRPYGEPPKMALPPGSSIGEKKTDVASMTYKRRLDGFNLTSISAFRQHDTEFGLNLYEGRTSDKLYGMRPDSYYGLLLDESEFYQELRLTSLPESALYWIIGANFSDSQRQQLMVNSYDTFFVGSPYNAFADRTYENTAFSIYGETTWPLADRLALTAGLRYTREDKTVDTYWKAKPSNPSPIREASAVESLTESYITGRTSLAYEVSEGSHLYLTYARGEKAGGFADFSTDVSLGVKERPYKSAKIDSIEFGYKYRSLGGDIAVTSALFFNDIKDDHVQVYDPFVFTMVPVNYDTRTQGAELSLDWQVTSSTQVSVGGAYTDAEIVGVPEGLNDGSKEGNRIPSTPYFSGYASLTHSIPHPLLNGGDFTTFIGYRYEGERAGDTVNTFTLPDYHQLDTKIGMSFGQFDVYVWGKNLTDEQFDLSAYSYGNGIIVGAPSRGRHLGVGASYAF